MKLNEIQELVAGDMEGVNNHIRAQLHSDVALIEQMGEYIVNSGGKRLRPVLAILAAKACGYKGERHHLTAAIIEFIHTATLLHDDVVDASDLRRGKETANAIWGNEASVLVGDFIFSRSFEMMVQVNEMRVLEVLASASNTIAEGEVLQLLNCHDPDTSEQQYMEVIRCKTAKLFEAAARLGPVLAQQSATVETALAEYGMRLGTAFQLIDDILDYRADKETLGKNVGDDLAEGKPTLPIIYALENGTAEQVTILRDVIKKGDRNKLDQVMEIISNTNALQYAEKIATKEAQDAKAAIDCLEENTYKNALISLVDFSLERIY